MTRYRPTKRAIAAIAIFRRETDSLAGDASLSAKDELWIFECLCSELREVIAEDEGFFRSRSLPTSVRGARR